MLQYSYRSGRPVTREPDDATDQRWLPYSPIVDRPPIRWPNGARLALWLCPCVLHYEFTPPDDPWINAWSRMPAPDVAGYGRQEYGNRVGFWRMLEVFDAHSMRPTLVVNSVALERYPDICAAIRQRDWDIIGHGLVNTRFVFNLTPSEERAYYVEMRDRVEALTGICMAGIGGPGPQAATDATVDILAELGFRYHGDWFCDDQPMPLRTRQGRLIAMPYPNEINDAGFFSMAFEAPDFLEAAKRQFDRLYAEGATSGRVMGIGLHPHLFGQPHRIGYLDELLAYIRTFPDVWHATGREIAAFYDAHCYDAMVDHLAQGGAGGAA